MFYVMRQINFQRVVLAIIPDLIHECVEVYMDGLSIYGNYFDEALINLVNVMVICIDSKLALSSDKLHMFLMEGIVMRHMFILQG